MSGLYGMSGRLAVWLSGRARHALDSTRASTLLTPPTPPTPPTLARHFDTSTLDTLDTSTRSEHLVCQDRRRHSPDTPDTLDMVSRPGSSAQHKTGTASSPAQCKGQAVRQGVEPQGRRGGAGATWTIVISPAVATMIHARRPRTRSMIGPAHSLPSALAHALLASSAPTRERGRRPMPPAST